MHNRADWQNALIHLSFTVVVMQKSLVVLLSGYLHQCQQTTIVCMAEICVAGFLQIKVAFSKNLKIDFKKGPHTNETSADTQSTVFYFIL